MAIYLSNKDRDSVGVQNSHDLTKPFANEDTGIGGHDVQVYVQKTHRFRFQPRYMRRQLSKPVPFPPLIVWPNALVWTIFGLFVLAVICVFGIFRGMLQDIGVSSIDILRIGAIPVISVGFTYFHIWFALYMTFYPIEFFGFWQIPGTNVGLAGWQGIIPSKAEKMARISCQLITKKLMDPKQIFAKIDPVEVSRRLGPMLRKIMEEVLEQVGTQESPEVWQMLPQHVKYELIEHAAEDSPIIFQRIFSDLRENIDSVFDIEDMVVTILCRDKQLLVNMFVEVGASELKFIRNNGATMGLIFGIAQMFIWIYYHAFWLQVIYGGIVGTITNFVALKVIFSPVEPIYVCGLKLQGLFMLRQKEVAAGYARMVSERILTTRNMIDNMLLGPLSDQLFELVTMHVEKALDESAGPSRPVLELALGKESIERVKKVFVDKMLQSLPDTMLQTSDYMDEAIELDFELRQRIQALSSKDYEGLLHPVFQEDEWKLIAIGGVLGFVIGTIQAFILIS